MSEVGDQSQTRMYRHKTQAQQQQQHMSARLWADAKREFIEERRAVQCVVGDKKVQVDQGCWWWALVASVPNLGWRLAINKHNGRCFGDGRWGWVGREDSQKPSDCRLQDVVEDKHALGTRGRGRYQRRDHVGLIAEVAWCHMPHPTIGA